MAVGDPQEVGKEALRLLLGQIEALAPAFIAGMSRGHLCA